MTVLRRLAVAAVLAGTVGCAANDTVTIPKSTLALTYADAKASIDVLKDRLAQACAAKKLDAATCASAAALADQLQVVEKQVREALTSKAAAPFDPALLQGAFELLVKLALRVAAP